MKLTWKCPSSNISPLKKFSFKFLVSRINKLQKGWVESGRMAKKKLLLTMLKKNVKKKKWCSNCLRILPDKECLLCNFWLSIPFIRFLWILSPNLFLVCLFRNTFISFKNPMDRGARQATVHEGHKSQQLNKNIHRRLFCAKFCMVKER